MKNQSKLQTFVRSFLSVTLAKIINGLVLVAAMLLSSPAIVQAANDSCECPAVSCGDCADQQGVTFYTEKCEGGQKVKSCARPKCVAKDPLPPTCNQPSAKASALESIMQTERAPTSVPEAQPVVGKVKVLKGEAWLVKEQGQKIKLSEGSEVQQADSIITDAGGEVKMEFIDGNNLHVKPSSEVNVKKMQFQGSSDQSKQTVLELLKGKIRSKVNQKYNGKTSYYQIRTKGAVAGVRGTDFVVTYEESDRAITKIETIEGNVALSDLGLYETIEVKAGSYASYVVAANDKGLFSEDEINQFVERGYMTPVYKMSAAEIKALDWDSAVEKVSGERAVASNKASSICHAPKADFNSCSWTCENNPKGEVKCRTDLAQVNCVRRRCNANGHWAEEMRLPASFGQNCEPQKTKTGPCDY